MPLYKTLNIKPDTKVFIWKITENLKDLMSVYLNNNSILRLNNMKSEIHKKGFLSIRHLLKEAGYSDDDLFYTLNGKPHLKNGKRISITHSFDFSAIIVSNNPVGIDIEKNRKKIVDIANKFIDKEKDFLKPNNLIEQLTVIWGAKECLYKIHPIKGLSFKNDIFVEQFNLNDKKTKCLISNDYFYEVYNIYFEKFENYTLVYAVN